MNIQLIDQSQFLSPKGKHSKQPTININPINGYISLNAKAVETFGFRPGKEHVAIGQSEGEWFIKATNDEGFRVYLNKKGTMDKFHNKALAKHLLKALALPGKELCTHKFRIALQDKEDGYYCIFHKSPISVK